MFRWKNKKRHTEDVSDDELYYDDYYAYYYAYYFDDKEELELIPQIEPHTVPTFERPLEMVPQPRTTNEIEPDLSSRTSLAKLLENHKSLENEIDDITEKLSHFQKTEETNDSLMSHNHELKTQISELGNKYNRLFETNEELTSEKKALLERIKQMDSIDPDTYAKVTSEHDKLKKQYELNDAIREKLVAQIHNLTQQSTNLKASLAEAEETFADREAELNETYEQELEQQQTQVRELTKSTSVLEETRGKLERNIIDLEAHVHELVGSHESELAEQIQRVTSLETDLTAVSHESGLASARVDELVREKETVLAELKEKTQVENSLRQELLTLKKIRTSEDLARNDEWTALSNRVKEHSEGETRLQQELEKLKETKRSEQAQSNAEISHLRLRVSELEATATRLHEDLARARAEAVNAETAQAKVKLLDNQVQAHGEIEMKLRHELAAIKEIRDQERLALTREVKQESSANTEEVAMLRQQVRDFVQVESQLKQQVASLEQALAVQETTHFSGAEAQIDHHAEVEEAKAMAQQMMDEAAKQQRLTDLNSETLKAEVRLLRAKLLMKIQESDNLFDAYTKRLN